MTKKGEGEFTPEYIDSHLKIVIFAMSHNLYALKKIYLYLI